MILNSADAPIASVRVDSGSTMVAEGQPVKLVCDIKANPPVESVVWYHGVSPFYDVRK